MDLENVSLSSNNISKSIQQINRDTVHRICSGQVVLSLAIAVKELVENAIDAGATIIDIQLKEYGSQCITVSDNGGGVEKENFQVLTLKHYTSKIKQFDDLATLLTLGFRGEALSSLCALSDLTVLTKHTTAENATKITYDRNGKISKETLSAREQGTTVTLENLFSTLVVRRKEFLKNLKREFNKMCQLLYAYCLVSKGIKFSCTNTTGKGSKNTVVATEGSNTIKENIVNVFGSKQISSLIEVEMITPEEAILQEYGVKLFGQPIPFSFNFFISSVVHGSGRSTTDRQFFYINSRPCEPTKIIKLVNEIYRQYNNSQYPFVYLNILSNSCLVDVNVTPDKRQVFLEKEKVLLATVKASLIEAFKNFPSTFKMQNLDLSQNSSITSFLESSKAGNTNLTSAKSSRGLKRSMTEGGIKKGSILQTFKKRSKTQNDDSMISDSQPSFNATKKVESKSTRESDDRDTKMLDTFIKIASEICENEAHAVLSSLNTETNELRKDKSEVTELNDNIEHVEEIKIVCRNEGKIHENISVSSEDEPLEPKTTHAKEKSTEMNEEKIENKKKIIVNVPKTKIKNPKDLDEDTEFSIDTTIRDRSNNKSIKLDITLDDVKKSLANRENRQESDDVKVRFHSKINPESNKIAEKELRKQISKEDFAKMTTIGQFNLGFIIARLRNDLFIIDQHATDEKYNFEQLQANTVMENQVLVNPKPLQLTAANECLLIENEEIFKKNGFTFKIDESAPCTKKVLLTSVPLSKSIVFGKDDIDEMLFMLQDSNIMCRPSRIRGMFASRACRKSVMIGKALSKSDMRRLIDHMGEIEQPWNCPHGRPTMRHLVNLDLIDKEKISF